MKHRSI